METDSPPQPAPDMCADKKIPGLWQAIILMVLFFIVNVSCGLVGGIVLVAAALVSGKPPNFYNSQYLIWVAGIGNLLSFAIVLAIGLFWSKQRLVKAFPFKRIPPQLIPAITMIGIGSSITCSEAGNIIQSYLPMPAFLVDLMEQLMQPGLGSILTVVIIAPLTEELFFRGFLHSGFNKRYSPTQTILVTSILFALFHINPYQFPIAFLAGLILSWLRLRTGSLTPCILLHVVINGLATGIQYLPVKIPGYNLTGEHSFQPWWWNLTGLTLVVIGLFGAHRVLREKSDKSTEEDDTNLLINADIRFDE